MKPVKVFCTSGSEEVAEVIFPYLKKMLATNLQMDGLAKHTVKEFSNENIEVQIEDVRGCYAVVIHTQVPPLSNHTIELFALLQAMRDAHVSDIFLVFPYMPYSRSDRKNKPRISTMGQLFAQMISKNFDIRHVLLNDPHDSHLKHYFEPVADEISAIYLFADYINEIIKAYEREQCMIVYADTTALRRYGSLAHITNLPTAFIDKDRPDDSEKPKINKLVGDVSGKVCILMDDEIMTGGTTVGDTEMILKSEASRVLACAVHPIFEKKGMLATELISRLEASPVEKFLIGNTVPLANKLKDTKKFVIVRTEKFLAEAISRLLSDRSLTDLHNGQSLPLYRIYS